VSAAADKRAAARRLQPTPAIDVMGGIAVRLAEGERERMTAYDPDPVGLAARFAAAGAPLVHVVDLDGAFEGSPQQLPLISAMVRAAHERGAKVQVGGGLRSVAAIEAVLAAGADRVVVGTLAVRDPEAVEALCARAPGRVVIAIDARDGVVAVDGWRQSGGISAATLAARAEQWGAAAVLFTDVARDGLQVGAATEATATLQRHVAIDVIASGGVGSLADLDALAAAGVRAVVIGRALYEGAFTLEEALQRC